MISFTHIYEMYVLQVDILKFYGLKLLFLTAVEVEVEDTTSNCDIFKVLSVYQAIIC